MLHQYRQHSDPFPLPPRWLSARVAAEGIEIPQRGMWIGRALNCLAMHGSNSDFDRKLLGLAPNAVQHLVAERVVERLREAGPPPADITPEKALSDLVSSQCLYNDEETKNLASFDINKLKILQANLKPRLLSDLLPTAARRILDGAPRLIELSKQERDRRFLSDPTVPRIPYWDPKLRVSKQARMELMVRLANVGVVTFRGRIREKIGIFFVKKKTPEWIRMVIDARRVNASHRTPPVTRLATPRAYMGLSLQTPTVQSPTTGNLSSGFGMEADACDCFYNFLIEDLADWFGVDLPLTIAEWKAAGWEPTSLWDSGARTYVTPQDEWTVYPVFRGLCMGWSWALHFANEAVANICNNASVPPSLQVRDRRPTPQVNEGPVLGVYVDNISIIGSTVSQVSQRAEKVKQQFADVGIPITWTQSEPVSVFESVGVVLDFEKCAISNKPHRIWRFFFATVALLRRKKIRGEHLRIWLGHATSLFMIAPCCLSVFYHCYKFVAEAAGRRLQIWRSVRQEMKHAAAVAWLTSANLSGDPIWQVDAGDSSSSAYALLTTLATREEIFQASQFRETWRFISDAFCPPGCCE